MFKNALRYSHELLQEVVQKGDLVVDATMGGGNDTLFLARLVGLTGQVLAFDIQDQALEQTKKRLVNVNEFEQVQLVKTGHENVKNFLDHNLKAGIFNLGFLPNSNHQIITKPETTLIALQGMLDHLLICGRVVLVIYCGHLGGEHEKAAILDYVMMLDDNKFTVLKYDFLNRKHKSPILIAIERQTIRKS